MGCAAWRRYTSEYRRGTGQTQNAAAELENACSAASGVGSWTVQSPRLNRSSQGKRFNGFALGRRIIRLKDSSLTMPLTTIRVLLVEDEVMIRMMVADMVEELGHAVAAEAGDVGRAAELAQAGLFDLAILDVNLNGKMSFPVADIIMKRGIPLIFASGYALENIPSAFVAAPKLQKPFQIDSLKRRRSQRRARALDISRWSTPSTIRAGPWLSNAARRGQLHPEATQGPTAITPLADRRRDADQSGNGNVGGVRPKIRMTAGGSLADLRNWSGRFQLLTRSGKWATNTACRKYIAQLQRRGRVYSSA